MMGGFDARGWAAVVIALAVAIGVIRLLLWQRSAPTDVRAPGWRLALLAALQLTAGALLHLVLFPPGVIAQNSTLIVATSGAPGSIERRRNEILVALPEAGELEGAVRVPDLATALRRFPGVARIRVEGDGLSPRDQGAASLPVDFDPPPRPGGLIEVAMPGWTAPGAQFSVGGQVGTLPAGTVELVDPANEVVDRARVAAGARFVLTSNTRAAGLALFTLRLRDRSGDLVEQVAVPVETREPDEARVLVLAGAPSAETKYLRRWAEDAGIDLSVQIDIGGGTRLGDTPVPLTRAALGDVDLLVIDDRRWETLDAGFRGALASAVDDGLGLLLRPTGPLSGATRRDWAVLGLPLTGGGDVRQLQLGPSRPARMSEGENGAVPDDLPGLARRDVGQEGPDAVSLLRDADGVAFASWRSRRTGRVGVWTVTDSYALVLTGRSERYGELWSTVFSALARPGPARPAAIDPFARAGARLAVCQVIGEARVIAPERTVRALNIDPETGERRCAAYWPERSGWHVVRDGGDRETPFYVHPAGAGASLAAFADREATVALTARTANGSSPAPAPRGSGTPWSWFGALLLVLALLWWLERNRLGRAGGGH